VLDGLDTLPITKSIATLVNFSKYQVIELVGLAGLDQLPPEPRQWQNPQVRGLAAGMVSVLLSLCLRASGWMPSRN
jgi:hypothetical protein